MNKKERFEKVLRAFEEKMPEAETELVYSNPYELLVSVILSAQCTDKRVNMVTPSLFKAYPDPIALSTAQPEDILPYIKSISYPFNKSKHLAGMARKLIEEFNGKIPSDVDQLQKLPGVGRKTANVIASVIYKKPTLAVDTHVFRVAARIGLVENSKTPRETERQLMKYIPRKKVHIAHHWFILHGRYICVARRPKCEICFLTDYCKYFQEKVKPTIIIDKKK